MLRQIALRNTIKNWRHSLSALLSLSASFVSLVLFDGYMDDVTKLYIDNFQHRQMIGQVIIENQDIWSKQGSSDPWLFWIKKDEQEKIHKYFSEQKNQVKTFVRSLQFQGMITNGSQSFILVGRGFDIENGLIMRGQNWKWNTLYGRPLHLYNNRFVVTPGQGLAKKLGCQTKRDFESMYDESAKAEKPFSCPNPDVQISATTVDGQLNAVDLQVVGIMDAGYRDIDDRYVQTSLEAAQTLMNTESVTFYAVELFDDDQTDDFVTEFNQKMAKENSRLHAVRWQQHRLGEMYTKTMSFLSIFRNFVIIVIVVVSTLSVMNTMIKIVKERAREIGTLRSLGYQAKEVMRMFLYESVYLSLIGTAIGMVLALFFTALLNAMRIMYKAGILAEPVPFRISLYWPAYLQATILLISVGVLACLISTRQLLKSKVIENLNYA